MSTMSEETSFIQISTKKIISKVSKLRFMDFRYYFSAINLNKESIKYQSYPKSRKIDAFGQEICFCHNLRYN